MFAVRASTAPAPLMLPVKASTSKAAAANRLYSTTTCVISTCVQGLKVLDDSVENLALNAMSALGSAWKGSVNLVHKLEQQAEALADSENVKSGLKVSFLLLQLKAFVSAASGLQGNLRQHSCDF
jgi:hypothetical protein